MNQLVDPLRPAEPLHPFRVVRGEGLVVPADGAADLQGQVVDAAGRVVRGGDAAGDPVLSRPFFRSCSARARTWPGVPFELGQVELAQTLDGMLPAGVGLAVQRSFGRWTRATTLPRRSNARHLTPLVLKSQPVMTAVEGSSVRGSIGIVRALGLVWQAGSKKRAPLSIGIAPSRRNGTVFVTRHQVFCGSGASKGRTLRSC